MVYDILVSWQQLGAVGEAEQTDGSTEEQAIKAPSL
jgi:hypothetical protein